LRLPDPISRSAPILLGLFLATATLGLSADPPERVVESVLASLAAGPHCWSDIDLRDLGERPVTVDLEAHRSSGALVPLTGHPQIPFHLYPGEHGVYKLEIPDESEGAWVKIREHVPSGRLSPAVAVSGAVECTDGNQLRSAPRQIVYPLRSPWFSEDVADLRGDMISLINTSERPARAAACYSAGGLYSVPAPGRKPSELTPICDVAFEVLIPPFGARQFPVERGGNTHFALKTQGDAIVLQMLHPAQEGVRIYTVDSSITFGSQVQ
jgi:hypothetical protein